MPEIYPRAAPRGDPVFSERLPVAHQSKKNLERLTLQQIGFVQVQLDFLDSDLPPNQVKAVKQAVIMQTAQLLKLFVAANTAEMDIYSPLKTLFRNLDDTQEQGEPGDFPLRNLQRLAKERKSWVAVLIKLEEESLWNPTNMDRLDISGIAADKKDAEYQDGIIPTVEKSSEPEYWWDIEKPFLQKILNQLKLLVSQKDNYFLEE